MTNLSQRLLSGAALSAVAVTLLIGCSKAPEVAPMAPTPPTSVGTKLDDSVITASVKTALLADPDVKSLDISVSTVKGEVQLTGFVNNQSQIDQAGTVARAAEGASSVKNDLLIKQP
jgi:hyperosmotically inducible protein